MNDVAKVAFEEKDLFEAARDSTKQFLTLSTAIIALTTTFGGNFLANASSFYRTTAVLAWLFFLLSVCFGLWTLLTLTGSAASAKPEERSIWSGNVTRPALAQVLTFLGGLFLTVIFGFGVATAPTKIPIPQGYRLVAEEHLVDVAEAAAASEGVAFDADAEKVLGLLASSELEPVFASWEGSRSPTSGSLSTSVEALSGSVETFTKNLVKAHQLRTQQQGHSGRAHAPSRRQPISGREVRSAFSLCPTWPFCH